MTKILASKRFSVYLLTLIAVIVGGVAGVATEVLSPIALGIGGGLPVLLGGESWIDVERTRKVPTPPVAGGGA